MGAKERESVFSQLLSTSASSIHETLTLLRDPAARGGKAIDWKDVLAAAANVAKLSTATGMLWGGHVSKKEGMQNIRSFTEALHSFLLGCHGSTVGAGPTLVKMVYISAKQVVDAGLSLLSGAITFSGNKNGEQKHNLPVLVGHVWEACEAVKKTPPNNCVAVGRSLTQVAVSIKDVVRELNEFKQASGLKEACEVDGGETRGSDELQQGAPCHEEDIPRDNGETESDDVSIELNEDLSAQEMHVVLSVKKLVSSLLGLMKELLHIVASTLQNIAEDSLVTAWERILELSQGLGVRVDELGASLYPPQEIEALQSRVEELEDLIEQLWTEVFTLNEGVVPYSFGHAINASKDAGLDVKKALALTNDSQATC